MKKWHLNEDLKMDNQMLIKNITKLIITKKTKNMRANEINKYTAKLNIIFTLHFFNQYNEYVHKTMGMNYSIPYL